MFICGTSMNIYTLYAELKGMKQQRALQWYIYEVWIHQVVRSGTFMWDIRAQASTPRTGVGVELLVGLCI